MRKKKESILGMAFFGPALVLLTLFLFLPMLLALAINKVTYCKKYFKVAFFVTVVMSLAVVSTLWIDIYSPEGILNTMLAQFGIDEFGGRLYSAGTEWQLF